jgi:hypothetical protein
MERVCFLYKGKEIEFISRPINENRMNDAFGDIKPQMIGVFSN